MVNSLMPAVLKDSNPGSVAPVNGSPCVEELSERIATPHNRSLEVTLWSTRAMPWCVLEVLNALKPNWLLAELGKGTNLFIRLEATELKAPAPILPKFGFDGQVVPTVVLQLKIAPPLPNQFDPAGCTTPSSPVMGNGVQQIVP